jgi:hypothetical protein
MLDVLLDTLKDSIKLLPFLFIAYFLMEYIEHKTSDKTQKIVEKSGRFGPILGSILGVFPQCGFSAMAANLYAGRIITLGTLIAIFLSTSDEMLPILISEAAPVSMIVKIIIIKIIVGAIIGVCIDLVLGKIIKNKEKEKIAEVCEHEHCNCDEEGVLKSSIKHTLNVFIYIFIISLILNAIIYFIGEDTLANVILNKPIIGPIIAGLIGLIPNCASSVLLTKLYLSNVISVSTMLTGLFVGSGVGILVLCKVNKNVKENIKIIALLYAIGVVAGIVLELCGLTI